MTTPEVVLGASLLALFLNLGVATGFWTIFIAHVMFNISFVVVTVKARLPASTATSRRRRWTSARTSGRRSAR